MTNPDWWQALIETALLGTERKPFTPDFLPIALQVPNAAASSEQALLQTAALAGNYLRAGSEPLAIILPDLPVCEPETQSYAPLSAVRLVQRLLDANLPGNQLLERCLKRFVESGWVVSPPLVIPLLEKLTKNPYAELGQLVLSVIGTRGRWLAEQNPDWQFILPPDMASLWQHGTKEERNAIIGHYRLTDPAKGRQLIEDEWNQLPLPQQRVWLTKMNNGFSEADEPFVDRIWNELRRIPKRKPTQQNIFQEAAIMLLHLPESELHKMVKEQLRQYMVVRKGMLARLTGRDSLSFVLPEQEDNFFNPTTMTDFGLETKDDVSDSARIRHWFFQLLSAMPPSHWQEIWQVTEADLVDFCLRQPFGKADPENTVQALEAMAVQHKTIVIARSLLASSYKLDFESNLIRLLPPAERETYVQQRQVDISQWVNSYPFLTYDTQPPWSVAFSQYVIQRFVNKLISQYQLTEPDRQFLADAATVLHPSVIADPETLTALTTQEYQKNSIQRQLIEPLTHWLGLRQSIEKLQSLTL
jgi:hypothetical protein